MPHKNKKWNDSTVYSNGAFQIIILNIHDTLLFDKCYPHLYNQKDYNVYSLSILL